MGETVCSQSSVRRKIQISNVCFLRDTISISNRKKLTTTFLLYVFFRCTPFPLTGWLCYTKYICLFVCLITHCQFPTSHVNHFHVNFHFNTLTMTMIDVFIEKTVNKRLWKLGTCSSRHHNARPFGSRTVNFPNPSQPPQQTLVWLDEVSPTTSFGKCIGRKFTQSVVSQLSRSLLDEASPHTITMSFGKCVDRKFKQTVSHASWAVWQVVVIQTTMSVPLLNLREKLCVCKTVPSFSVINIWYDLLQYWHTLSHPRMSFYKPNYVTFYRNDVPVPEADGLSWELGLTSL